jgi:hypothetical protein
MLAWMIRTTAGGGPDRVPSPDRALPQPDQPEPSRRPVVSLMREGGTAAASGDETWRARSADMVGNQAGGMAAGRHAEPDDLGFSA